MPMIPSPVAIVVVFLSLAFCHAYQPLRGVGVTPLKDPSTSVDIGDWLSKADLLITYVAGPFPDEAQCAVLRDWLEQGGRWLAASVPSDRGCDAPRAVAPTRTLLGCGGAGSWFRLTAHPGAVVAGRPPRHRARALRRRGRGGARHPCQRLAGGEPR